MVKSANINKSKELFYIHCVKLNALIPPHLIIKYSHIKFLCFCRYLTLKFRPGPKQYICCLPQFRSIEYLVNCRVLLSISLLKYVTVENCIFIYLPAIVYLIGLLKYTLNCDL